MKYKYFLLAAGIFVTLLDAYDTKTVHKGEMFDLSLSSLASAGYSWQISPAGIDSEYLELISDIYDQPQSHLIGGPGTQTFSFKAKKVGRTTLELEYKRPWEKDIAKTNMIRVIIKNKKRT